MLIVKEDIDSSKDYENFLKDLKKKKMRESRNATLDYFEKILNEESEE